jgi:hypothetical chaperone protein
LRKASISTDSIQTVFLTGGTSLIPSLREQFIRRFGRERIREGHEFTSVADGLGLSAPLFFAALHRKK